MKKASISLLSLLAVVCFAFSSVISVQAQNSRFVISAKAGGVNYVSGDVLVQQKDASGWQSLKVQDTLEAGDLVRTGMGARAEVLLNPGSYVRVAENSEFSFADTAIDTPRLNLNKGTAIIEATGLEDAKLDIEIVTPQTKVAIIKKGIYRVSILPGTNATEVSVRKGQALVGNDMLATVKGGKKIVAGGGNTQVAKLMKSDRDDFDLWSEQRAKMLAEANSKLTTSQINSAFSGSNPFGFNTFSLFDSPSLALFNAPFGQFYVLPGGWFFNSFYGCYTFLPFYSWYSSPYGYNYGGFLYVVPGSRGSNQGGHLAFSPGTGTNRHASSVARIPGADGTASRSNSIPMRRSSGPSTSAPPMRTSTGSTMSGGGGRRHF